MRSGLKTKRGHPVRIWIAKAFSWRSLHTGYTIVEVMIVLAVTGLLFVSVVTVFAGQQNKTQFSQAINDIDNKIRDTITNVDNGYYANYENFYCDALGGAGPVIHPGSDRQGQNTDCIFIGRSMQFAPDSDQTRYNIYNVVAQRAINGNEATTLNEAKPKAVGPNGPVGADATERNNLLYGLKAVRMYYKQGASRVRINTVSFISSLPGYTGADLNPGSTTVQLMPVNVSSPPTPNIQTTGPGNSEILGAQNINETNMGPGAIPPTGIPDGGVILCFESGGTDQYGIITIGSSNRQLTTKVTIASSADALAGDCNALY
jgi:hypothetical protein